MTALVNSNCISTPTLLNDTEVSKFIVEIKNWKANKAQNIISREFKLKNYYNTIAFVNAVAWIVHQQDHHPDIQLSYNKCHISFSTHSVSGLSVNDFICAAKINSIEST